MQNFKTAKGDNHYKVIGFDSNSYFIDNWVTGQRFLIKKTNVSFVKTEKFSVPCTLEQEYTKDADGCGYHIPKKEIFLNLKEAQ